MVLWLTGLVACEWRQKVNSFSGGVLEPMAVAIIVWPA
jgi:hypothetical protein